MARGASWAGARASPQRAASARCTAQAERKRPREGRGDRSEREEARREQPLGRGPCDVKRRGRQPGAKARQAEATAEPRREAAAVESAHLDQKRCLNIAPHPRGRCCGQRQNRHGRELLAQDAELDVVAPPCRRDRARGAAGRAAFGEGRSSSASRICSSPFFPKARARAAGEGGALPMAGVRCGQRRAPGKPVEDQEGKGWSPGRGPRPK